MMNEKDKQYLLEQINTKDDIGEISDGYHTFNSLYNQRLYLFAALVNAYREYAWKTKKHEDGELCFGGGWFLVGITTPDGDYSYHYELKDWDLFDCRELDVAPHFDGHTDKDVPRLMSLNIYNKVGENSLRCWNCIHNEDCEEKFNDCVANYVLNDKVVHDKTCETQKYRERYENIGRSEWFKKHYHNKSIGDVIDVLDDFINNQKPLPGEYCELVKNHFWELINE